MQQYVFEYVHVALGRQWPRFFYFFRGITFMHAQYIKIMHVLDSTRQKFNVL